MNQHDLKVAQSLGRIEQKLDSLHDWMTAVNRKVEMNTRWRWGLVGIVSFISAMGTVYAWLK